MKPRRVAARYWIYGGFLVFALAVLGRVSAVDWRTASHEPVGLAPDPANTSEAIVQVYAARTRGWRGGGGGGGGWGVVGCRARTGRREARRGRGRADRAHRQGGARIPLGRRIHHV